MFIKFRYHDYHDYKVSFNYYNIIVET